MDQLLWPHTPQDFLTHYYEREPLHIHGRGDSYYRGLFCFEDVEAAVAAAPDPMRDGGQATYGIRVLDGQRQHYYFDDQGPAGRSNTAPHRAFDEGYTIVANTLNQNNEAVAQLCRSMEAALQQPLNCNVYLTPPGAQGFPPHADMHDTYLAQIEGSKRWQLWAPELDLPMTGSIENDLTPARAPDRILDLEAGDLLYIPHGWWHRGETSSQELSLHLTLGSKVLKWVDLVVEAVKALANHDVRLRRSVTFTGAPAVFDETADEVWATATELARDAALAIDDVDFGRSVLRGILGRRVDQHPPPYETRLRSTSGRAGIDLTSVVEQRSGLRAIVDDVPGGCQLKFVGGFISGPTDARRAFEFVAKTPQFSAADLPDLPADFQLQLVQELVLQGMVRVVAP